MSYVTANDAELRALYEAARRVGYMKAAFNSFEDWCEKVGDHELDDARSIIALENEQEHKRLREAVIKTAIDNRRADNAINEYWLRRVDDESYDDDSSILYPLAQKAYEARVANTAAVDALIEFEKRSVQP